MRYQPGERVALVHTDDPHTTLRPGDEGTVVRHDKATHTVGIDWDTGSRPSTSRPACTAGGCSTAAIDWPPRPTVCTPARQPVAGDAATAAHIGHGWRPAVVSLDGLHNA